MLDIKHIIDNADDYSASVYDRGMKNVVPRVIELYKKSIELQQRIETLQRERNKLSKHSEANESDKVRARGKIIKKEITDLTILYDNAQNELQSHAKIVPNLCHIDAPRGKEEKDNLVIKTHGRPRQFSFKPKDHVQLGSELDIIDFERASTVSGAKFYYLKNHAVLLELALLRFGIDILQKRGFDILQTPDLAKTSIVDGIGFNPRGNESNIYNIEYQPLSLIGTAEITLGGYYANSIVSEDDFPIKLAGISHCFRKEAGASGQYSKGLYRVHQFTKLEMFIFCTPEKSDQLHRQLLEIEEHIYATLEIPYRVVDTCTGDLGAPAYRKFDIEAWMPGRTSSDTNSVENKNVGAYGEITSASNCTDYQSRRLKIRMQRTDEMGKKTRIFPHMLNGTAIAISRTLVALLENFQTEDGGVAIPAALVPYCGFDHIPPHA